MNNFNKYLEMARFGGRDDDDPYEKIKYIDDDDHQAIVETFIEMLKMHDKTFQMAEGRSYYDGRQQLNSILATARWIKHRIQDAQLLAAAEKAYEECRSDTYPKITAWENIQ